jgi:phosphoribosylanthranilate isomerase
MINIKVCGITTLKQLQQLEGLNIEFAGLIFAKESPRYVADKLDPKEITGLDLDIKKVGVFVNADFEEIVATAEKYELDLVQLHGDESPELCADLTDEGLEVIKAFRIGENTGSIDDKIKDYDDVCDYYLFDTVSTETNGGTGKKFDWKKVKESKIEKPFFLSGGIGPDDAAVIKKFKHPDFYGIDINSLFEKEPGVKDMGAVLKFMRELK